MKTRPTATTVPTRHARGVLLGLDGVLLGMDGVLLGIR